MKRISWTCSNCGILNSSANCIQCRQSFHSISQEILNIMENSEALETPVEKISWAVDSEEMENENKISLVSIFYFLVTATFSSIAAIFFLFIVLIFANAYAEARYHITFLQLVERWMNRLNRKSRKRFPKLILEIYLPSRK